MNPIAVLARAVGAIVLVAAALPVLAQSQPSNETAAQRAEQRRETVQPFNNAPVWREVRSGQEQYTTLPGREYGVLIQSYGQTWRELRNGPITFWGGWLIVLVVVLIGLYYRWRGPLKVHEPPTGRLIERFTPFERIVHWTVAIAFSILGITGLVILFGKYILLPVIGYTLFAWLTQLSKHLHNFTGPIFIFSIVVMFVLFARDNLPRLHDFRWLVKLGGMLSGKHVPSDRFNAGEKLWFWLGVLVLGAVMSVTGLVLDFPNFEQTRSVMINADIIHAIAGVLFISIGLGHIYLGTIGLEGAYQGMRYGYVDESWAKEHHEFWYNDIKAGRIKIGRAAGVPMAPQVQG